MIAISFKDKLKEIGSSTNGFFDLLSILLGVIIGAQFGGLAGGIIGAAIGGVYGGIVGGVVGISLGLAIHWSSITYDAVPNRTAGSGFSGGGGFGSRTSRASLQSLQVPPISAAELPRLATSAVIPPNREFLAVLGDQRSGTSFLQSSSYQTARTSRR